MLLELDWNDPDAHPLATVMSIPESIFLRFSSALGHTTIVLNALREHAYELTALILARRPGPTPGDLFAGEPAAAGGVPLEVAVRMTL